MDLGRINRAIRPMIGNGRKAFKIGRAASFIFGFAPSECFCDERAS